MPSTMSTPTLTIPIVPLTPSSFSAYGTVISNPFPPSTNPPTTLPANASLANQGSAIKLTAISPLTNNYASAPSQTLAREIINMFVCLPRTLSADPSTGQKVFDVQILERHPFTSQTFVPMGLDSLDEETCFVIIVAPTVSSLAASQAGNYSTSWTEQFASLSDAPVNPPDLSMVQAFIGRGSQGVTYAAGTWHAPMVVLGKKAIEFVVVQFANGVGDEDCQEVEFDKNGEGGLRLIVDLADMGTVKAKI